MTDVRVLTPTDVDGKTVIMNSDNKLQAILVDSPSAGITEQQFNTYLTQNLEVVEEVSNFNDAWGNWIDSPFGFNIAGEQHMIDRVGRIKGTNWLVLGSSTMT